MIDALAEMLKAKLSEVADERDRLKEDLAEKEKLNDDLLVELCRCASIIEHMASRAEYDAAVCTGRERGARVLIARAKEA